MQKRGIVFLFIFIILGILFSSVGIAQEEETDSEGIEAGGLEEFEDELFIDEFNDEEDFDGEDEQDELGEEEFEDGILEEAEKEFEDEELELSDPGLTPDSALYFFDELFDRFSGCLENREEKVAEMRVMIEEGKIDEAREALAKYEVCAEKVEREVSPEERKEAR